MRHPGLVALCLGGTVLLSACQKTSDEQVERALKDINVIDESNLNDVMLTVGDPADDLPRQPCCGVHRHRAHHPVGPLRGRGIPRVDPEVDRSHLVAARPQHARRSGDAEGLVPQLVRRDQQDLHVTTISSAAAPARRAASTVAGSPPRANRKPR